MPPGREALPTEQPAGNKSRVDQVAEEGSYKYQLQTCDCSQTRTGGTSQGFSSPSLYIT